MPPSARAPSPIAAPAGGRLALRVTGGIVLGVALVVAVAVLASGSGGDDGAFSVPQLEQPTAWFEITLTALALLSILVFVLIVVATLSNRGGPPERVRPGRTIPGMLLAGLLLWVGLRTYEPNDEPVLIEPPPTVPAAPDPAGDASGSSSSIDIAPILAGGALVLAAGCVIVWSVRRSSTTDQERFDDTAVHQRRDLLIFLLDDAIAKLRAHPDPREAVIATWSRLEVALGAVDLDRAPSDTPSRYLTKVLGTVEASAAAVGHLTATFERAMFSPHAIDRDDQQQAVDALVAVRDELHVLARRPTGAGTR